MPKKNEFIKMFKNNKNFLNNFNLKFICRILCISKKGDQISNFQMRLLNKYRNKIIYYFFLYKQIGFFLGVLNIQKE